MALAGLIKGTYDMSGMTIHSGYLDFVTNLINENAMPASAYGNGAGYMLGHVDTNFATAPHLFGRGFIVAGTITRDGTGTADFQQPLFTPEAAQQIDQKIDDGVAKTGKIIGANWPNANLCTSGSNYNMNETYINQILCNLLFDIQ